MHKSKSDLEHMNILIELRKEVIELEEMLEEKYHEREKDIRVAYNCKFLEVSDHLDKIIEDELGDKEFFENFVLFTPHKYPFLYFELVSGIFSFTEKEYKMFYGENKEFMMELYDFVMITKVHKAEEQIRRFPEFVKKLGLMLRNNPAQKSVNTLEKFLKDFNELKKLKMLKLK